MKNYEKWFKKAEEDIYTAKLLLKETDSPVCIICFHSQQAAEKYLKAYLVVRNIDFPKTHDLKILINICLTFNQKFFRLIHIILSAFVAKKYVLFQHTSTQTN